MIRKTGNDPIRHRNNTLFMNPEITEIVKVLEHVTNDRVLAESLYIGPTSLTHIKHILESSGTIIADTDLLAKSLEQIVNPAYGVQICSFIDDEQVKQIAELRHITRAEVAVDAALTLTGPKLMVIGSAPAAINRLIYRRQHEPICDVCVLAAPNGFASVVQLKERLIDSDLATIVVRGKKGGVPTTLSVFSSILKGIGK